MKKALIVVALLLCAGSVRAEGSILDQIYAGFVGRAKMAVESTSKGTVQTEFLVNYVELGQLKGEYIAAIDAGVLGTIPDQGHIQAADWTTGAKIHLAPIFKNFVPLPAEWQFLASLELDARASYNWRQHHPFYGIVAAVPFK